MQQTKQLTNSERDSMRQFVHQEVISNSFSDIASRMFHGCIKRVESVTLSDIFVL